MGVAAWRAVLLKSSTPSAEALTMRQATRASTLLCHVEVESAQHTKYIWEPVLVLSCVTLNREHSCLQRCPQCPLDWHRVHHLASPV